MPAKVRRLDVLIASPGDAAKGRDAVERALHEWNDHRGSAEGIMLRPRRWEIASVPIMDHEGAQSVINSQLVDEADIVIGIFYHRLGTATPRALSGTVEEIERANTASKPVHLFFSTLDLPPGKDPVQYQALLTFKAQVEQRGLILGFPSEERLARLAMNAIEFDVHQLNTVASPSPSSPASELEVYFLRWQANAAAIEIHNMTAREMSNLEVKAAIGDGRMSKYYGPSLLGVGWINRFRNRRAMLFGLYEDDPKFGVRLEEVDAVSRSALSSTMVRAQLTWENSEGKSVALFGASI